MNSHDKKLAESVLANLCLGARIDGVRFGPILQILITDHNSENPRVPGQIYLNLASNWAVFSGLPASLPEYEADLPELSEEDELRMMCDLRGSIITGIELGVEQPHLLIYFEDGRVLFLNGRDEHYESWQLGVAFGNPQERWLLVAGPNGGIAVWVPDSFDNTKLHQG